MVISTFEFNKTTDDWYGVRLISSRHRKAHKAKLDYFEPKENTENLEQEVKINRSWKEIEKRRRCEERLKGARAEFWLMIECVLEATLTIRKKPQVLWFNQYSILKTKRNNILYSFTIIIMLYYAVVLTRTRRAACMVGHTGLASQYFVCLQGPCSCTTLILCTTYLLHMQLCM